jgi:uncharacterized protein YndB with AHSA1/START domain
MSGEIEITRVFHAPRERVWRAWTEPEELVRWWGKRGWTAQRSSLVMEVRPGGLFRVVTISDDGRELVSEGVYREVVAPERLSFGDATVTFADLGDGRTRMNFRTTMRASDDLRAAAAGGLASAFERLEELLLHVSAAVEQQREEPR